MSVGRLVSGARISSGRTVRAIAADADVAGSTVTRIQSGEVDPSIGTLRRILDSAGFSLDLTAFRHGSEPRHSLTRLAGAWSERNGRLHLRWTRWRALLDDLALHPELVPETIYRPPWPSGHPVVDALLAAVAEKLADDANLPRPIWATNTPALDEPFEPPVVRQRSLSVPPQLAARSLMIDTESLWRDRTTIGV